MIKKRGHALKAFSTASSHRPPGGIPPGQGRAEIVDPGVIWGPVRPVAGEAPGQVGGVAAIRITATVASCFMPPPPTPGGHTLSYCSILINFNHTPEG